MTQDIHGKKDKILKDYAELRKALNRDIKIEDLKTIECTRDMLVHHWRSLANIDLAARERYPNHFNDIHVDSTINKQTIKELKDVVLKHDTFLITTAVTGCEVDVDFY